MRCVECETDPPTQGNFCECCGRNLSVQEGEEAVETTSIASGIDRDPFERNRASGGFCESCGRPTTEGSLCESCQQAFDALLSSARLTAKSSESKPTDRVSHAATVPASADLASGTAPVRAMTPSKPDLKTPNVKTVEMHDAKAGALKADTRDDSKVEEAKVQAAKDGTAKDQAARAEAARAIAASVLADRAAAAAKRQQASSPKGPMPVMIANPIASASSSRRPGRMVVAASILVIAGTIGALQGARWLGIANPGNRQEAGTRNETTVVGSVTPSREHSAKELVSRKSTIAMRKRTPSAQPASSTSTRPGIARAQVDARQPSSQQLAPVVAIAPPAGTPAPAIVSPPVRVAVEQPQRVADAASEGRLFEPTDVDESPRIISRVEPKLPAGLTSRAVNDIVVVRVLISQNGHPFRISLLRESKLGRSMDDAVVAAVTRWKFSPARKRGEPVNSWYHIGVPIRAK